MDTKHTIKKYAHEAGFDLCGITSADIIPEAKDHFLKWLQHGNHATMSWLEKDTDRRTNPRKVLPGAQSVIMLAVNYYSTDLPESKERRIARYARGRDYHRVLEGMMKRLCGALKTAYPEESFRYYVDYGPLLERAYAAKAGLGFIGKNSMLITKEYGSYVLLCEIITTLASEYDTPMERRCGTCTRCLEGCPTEAISEKEGINSDKCISFQTIENKSTTIPDNIAKNMSGFAFGCDICQEVCPFNNPLRLQETTHEDLKPRYTSIEENQALTSDEHFHNTYAGTPLMRAKRSGILRNIKSGLL